MLAAKSRFAGGMRAGEDEFAQYYFALQRLISLAFAIVSRLRLD
jgi:hypothetical protein